MRSPKSNWLHALLVADIKDVLSLRGIRTNFNVAQIVGFVCYAAGHDYSSSKKKKNSPLAVEILPNL